MKLELTSISLISVMFGSTSKIGLGEYISVIFGYPKLETEITGLNLVMKN